MRKKLKRKDATDTRTLMYTCMTLLSRMVMVIVFLIFMWGTLTVVSPETSVLDFTPDWSRLDHTRITPPLQSASMVENGIHLPSGLKEGPGRRQVETSCLSCHSSKLITQNSATSDGWESMIDWMQATQGLPALGGNRKVIVDYLSEYYAPQEYSRRAPLELEETEWYILNLE